MHRVRTFAYLALLFGVTGAAQGAAHIVWSTPSTISGDSDVINTGTTVAAYNIGGPSVGASTINGVTFAAFPIVDGGTATSDGTLTVMGFSNEPMSTATALGSGSAPFSGLSSNYQAMLGMGATKSSNTIHFMDMKLSNLTVGQTYTLQIWTNNSNAITTSASMWDFFGDHVQAIDINTTDAAGGVGQWLTGTFTADDVDEPFFMHGEPFVGGLPFLNGVQLRSVPEPATCGVLALLGSAMMLRRSRKVS